MQMRAVTMALGVALLTGLLAGQGMAATNNNTNNNNKQFTFKTPQPTNGDVVAAQKELDAATVENGKAKGSVNTVVAKLRRDFEASPDYTAAAAALREAQAAYDAARQPVIEGLMNKPEYAAAKAAKAKADDQQEAMRGDASATIEQRTAAATVVMNAGNKVTQMEGEALAADPKVSDAKAKMIAAQAKVSELVKAFEESLKSNAEWTAAKASEDQAATKLEAAKAKLKQATATFAQQTADWNKQRDAAYQAWLKKNNKTNTNTNKNTTNTPAPTGG